MNGTVLEREPDTGNRTGSTVLFTDIVASTERLASVGDQRWIALLDRHLATMSSVATAHGGSVVGFRGDGFQLVFGDELSGVRSALRLQYAFAVQDEVPVRIGVSSGPVERLRWGLSGLTVHVTARLTDLCAPGEVLVSETTYQAARAAYPQLPALVERELAIRGLPHTWPARSSDPIEVP